MKLEMPGTSVEQGNYSQAFSSPVARLTSLLREGRIATAKPPGYCMKGFGFRVLVHIIRIIKGLADLALTSRLELADAPQQYIVPDRSLRP